MNLIIDFLLITGVVILSIYIYILSKSKERKLPQRVLITFFALLFFVLIDSYAYLHQIEFLNLISFLPSHSSKLFLGPLLLLYINSLFFDEKEIFKRSIKTFIPFVLFLITISIPTLIAIITKKYFLIYLDISDNQNLIIRIISDSILLIYLMACLHSFFKFKKAIKCTYTYFTYNNFIWVRYILIAVLITISIDLIFALYQLFFDFFPWRSQSVIMMILVVAVVFAGYFGINQSKVLVPYFLLEEDEEPIDIKVSNELTLKDEIEFTGLQEKLKNVLEKEKIFLDEELTLVKLSKAIETTDKKLSKLLNQFMKVTFYDFVNSYRIDEFKEKIQSSIYNDFTIEGIANECGFKSKASFYRVFKKETGVSPSEFKHNVK